MTAPVLFIMVMGTITRNCRRGLPWELFFADDLVIMGDSEEVAIQGLKVNTNQTEVMVASREETRMNIVDRRGNNLNQVNSFKYLGLLLNNNGSPEDPVKAKVTAAWYKWRQMSGVLGECLEN